MLIDRLTSREMRCDQMESLFHGPVHVFAAVSLDNGFRLMGNRILGFSVIARAYCLAMYF